MVVIQDGVFVGSSPNDENPLKPGGGGGEFTLGLSTTSAIGFGTIGCGVSAVLHFSDNFLSDCWLEKLILMLGSKARRPSCQFLLSVLIDPPATEAEGRLDWDVCPCKCGGGC